ncbi:MAG: hypothetical protein MSC30_09860 [Gaiellaceae bacterium MAG52_C11]|nr:hypothetical protein [Candidatus Gaiellasilicea maunaloa]
MDSVWIALTAIGTLALVGVGVWQIQSSRKGARRREEREAEARRVAAERQEREKWEAQERAEQKKAPALSVREAAGFNGREREVEIYAELVNDGGSTARGAVVEARIDNSAVASSQPVDVAAGASERVSLFIPRQYVENLAGERPRYPGELTLRVS